MEVVLTKSKKPDKKYDARIDGTKTITFGQKGASDFTKHKNPHRKYRYIYIYIETYRHIHRDIQRMRIGLNQVQKLMGFTANMFFGISLL